MGTGVVEEAPAWDGPGAAQPPAPTNERIRPLPLPLHPRAHALSQLSYPLMNGTPVLPLLQVVFDVRLCPSYRTLAIIMLTGLAVYSRSLPCLSGRIHPCAAGRPR